MKALLRFLAAVCCTGALLAQDAAGPSKLKLVFWNVEWFPGGRPEATNVEAAAQIPGVVAAIRKLNPDVLGLEEVMNWNAATIAILGLPDLSVQVCSDFPGDEGMKTTQQLVIASRLPAIGGWWEPWKAGGNVTPKRGFSFAAFQPAPGQVLLVYCVHLKSNRGELTDNIAMREESAKQLLDHVAAMEKAYSRLGKVSVVAGGDFNTSLDDPKFKGEGTLGLLEKAGFQSCWKDVPFAERVTLPSVARPDSKFPPFPDACFDHVYVKGAAVTSAAVETLEPNPSDHRPVVVEIALPAAAN